MIRVHSSDSLSHYCQALIAVCQECGLHYLVIVDACQFIIIIIIDNRGLNARWCLTPFLLSLPTAAYLGQRGLIPAGLSHTTAQCHLTILGKACQLQNKI